MPFISTKTSIAISQEKKLSLKAKFGEAIQLLPGKSESWLMLSFEDTCTMFFQGSDAKPLAYVEVKLFGKSTADAYQNLTRAITEIIHEELGIAADCIYVTYQEISTWGWNGSNF